MKRVNLLEYYELAENLHGAKRALSGNSMKGGMVWVNISGLPRLLDDFVRDDNGFSTSKTPARDLSSTITAWINTNLLDGNSPPNFSTENFDKDFSSWQLDGIPGKIDAFRSVFAAECSEVDVYSVGQVAIYRTSALVSDGAGIIPADIQPDMPRETLVEFNSAGRCLAFDLPTACGFHALRGLELVMDDYLKSFGVTSKKRTWNDYIRALDKLINAPKGDSKPAPKVVAMLDRMRELERNPLMHPRDTLDAVQADMLFKLCAITVIEIVRDLQMKKGAENAPVAVANVSDLASIFLAHDKALAS